MAIKYDRFNPESAIPQIESVVNDLIEKVYPVGSYYYTGDQRFDPNKEFGGRWKKTSSNPYTWLRLS